MGLKVVVTGGSSGIGRASALRFAEDGHDVFITGRSEAKLEETVSLGQGAGSTGVISKGVGDVQVEADVLRNHEEAIKALGRIDVVVLSAGVGWPQMLVEDHSAAEYDSVINTNVRGVFLWLKAVLPAFKKQKWGQIVIVNSGSGLAAYVPGVTIYSASKFALIGLAEGLRLELQGTGVKVGSVLPGAVDTEMWTGTYFDERKIDARKEFALDLALLPEDIADAIATIAYQDPRSDIDLLRIWPNYGPRQTAKAWLCK